VVGAIGPLGIRLEPFGPTSRFEAFEHFTAQAQGLIDGGVDGFILETFSDVEEIHEALRAVRAICDPPIVAQMTIQEDGLTASGTSPEVFARALDEFGADVIGVGVNPAALDPERELKRFAWKVDAGAELAITQPVFDPVALSSWRTKCPASRSRPTSWSGCAWRRSAARRRRWPRGWRSPGRC